MEPLLQRLPGPTRTGGARIERLEHHEVHAFQTQEEPAGEVPQVADLAPESGTDLLATAEPADAQVRKRRVKELAPRTWGQQPPEGVQPAVMHVTSVFGRA